MYREGKLKLRSHDLLIKGWEGGGGGGYITVAWPSTIVGNIFAECKTPCPLKSAYVDSENK